MDACQASSHGPATRCVEETLAFGQSRAKEHPADVGALELTALAIGTSAVGLTLAIVVYALGSFLLMRRHTTARTLGISLRELARETVLAGITQPFLPLFYLLGYRMDPFFVRIARERDPAAGFATRVPVVFVHGYMQNRVGFFGLALQLARRRVGPLYGFNYPWFMSIASNARRLERFIERVCVETRSSAVDLVCHSMGGLVAMEMMRAEACATKSERDSKLKVRRCVTIATPHAGVVWRGPMLGIGATSLRRGSKLLEAHAGFTLTVPTLSLFSSHDNIVHPKETSSLLRRGGRDVEVEGFGHLAILFSSAVADHVASFLSEDGAEGTSAAAPQSATAHGRGSEVIVAAQKEPDVRAIDPNGSSVAERSADPRP